MPTENAHLRGIRLTEKPTGLTKCGLSRATVANLCKTNQWYKLSTQGQIIGQPTEFDFYRQEEQRKVVVTATATENQV